MADEKQQLREQAEIEKLRADVNLPRQVLDLLENLNRLLAKVPADQAGETGTAVLDLIHAATDYLHAHTPGHPANGGPGPQ